MAEGDTVHRIARRLDSALGGQRIRAADVPNPASPLRARTAELAQLVGGRFAGAEARGKHLLLHFDRDLVLHSHLGMRGSWRVVSPGQGAPPGRRAWVVLSAEDAEAVELGGSRLDIRTEQEVRSDPRLRLLGPDVLGSQSDAATGVTALRRADQSRRVGEALLD